MRALHLVLPFVALPALAAGRVGVEAPSFPVAYDEVAIDEADLVGALGDDADFVPGQYIVVVKSDRVLRTLAGNHGLEQVRVLGPQSAVVVRGVSAAGLRALRSDRDVAMVIPDAIARIVAKPGSGPGGGGGTTTPPPPQVLPAGVDRVGADETSNNGAGTVVCVVDTGIDYNHADLRGNYLYGKDFVNNDDNAMDDHGHGTHCAGTIAANDDNQGVVGVAPEAQLLGAKVLNRRGSGSYSGITEGVNWCVAEGADVISMSLGGSFNDPSMLAALIAAKAAGVTIVVAAGNEAVNLDDTPKYPAAYDGTVITVSAANVGEGARAITSDIGEYPYWSNWGTAVDLSAPGVSVLSDKKGGGTTLMSGTSMATPHVAGAAAMYISAHAGATPDQVEAALELGLEDVRNDDNHPEEMLNVRGF